MLRKMKPGQPGTKRLLEQYGERLVCVRYRYDARMRKRIKTVEIVVAESEWVPPPPPFLPDEVIWLRIGFVDRRVAQELRASGGKWDNQRCVWNIRYAAAEKLGFAKQAERRELSL